MWGAAAGLAGKAVPWILGGATVAGGVGSAMTIPKNIREGYLSSDIPASGNYDVAWWHKPFIDESSLKTEKQKRTIQQLEKDPLVAQRIAALAPIGVVSVKPGETKGQFLARTDEAFTKHQQKLRRESASADSETAFHSSQGQWERGQAESREAWQRAQTEWQNQESARQFDNNLAQARQTRIENLELQRDKLGLGRLELQMNQDRAMYEAETRRQDRKEKRTSALIQALAGLGAAFAI